jgi:hypothetical protein
LGKGNTVIFFRVKAAWVIDIHTQGSALKARVNHKKCAVHYLKDSKIAEISVENFPQSEELTIKFFNAK